MGTVIRAALAYSVLLLLLRVTARRTGKRMTTVEILLIFLLGGQMTQSILGDDRSFTNALLGVSTVAMMHTLVSWIKTRSTRVARLIDGTPLLIYANGEWLLESMNLVRVQKEDVLQAAREDGLENEERIRYAIVERNGAISIIKRE